MSNRCLTALACALLLSAAPAAAERILFVGNSFTFGAGSPVRAYRPGSVRDINQTNMGGVPALFRTFAEEAGLEWEVSLEAVSGQDFAYHLANRRSELTGAWDVVVLQDYSTLDKARPGDPATHIRDAARLAELFRAANPRVRVMLETSWSRADLTYPKGTHWFGQPIARMTQDIARANVAAIRAAPDLFAGTLPVGEAWLRAMDEGVADANPYDGIAFNKIDLWTWDHYHASAYGYYLSALVIFGRVTGVDPRRLGEHERAAEELGFSGTTTTALQRVAAAELAHAGVSGTRRERPAGVP